MDDKPSQALRRGRWKSSMWKAIEAVKTGEADACRLGRQYRRADGDVEILPAHHGQHRTPGDRGHLADAARRKRRARCRRHDRRRRAATDRFRNSGRRDGAGAVRVERPSVGLLNVGVEEIKGQEEVKDAGRMLREANLSSMSYHGFVEGDDIGKGTVDVVVTEGFAGNIALKTAEGTARQIAEYLARR
jgi:glycerol-3-phosphate acyltransferase PlsX